MIVRVVVVVVLVLAGAIALWRPAPRAAIVAASPQPELMEHPRRARFDRHELGRAQVDGSVGGSKEEVVVYVAGAVRRPGLYRLREGDRYDRAVSLAGGFGPGADATGVNLAQRAADGEEVLVPRVGESVGRSRTSHRTSRRHRRTPSAPADGSVDVNGVDAGELARVPGIGRAIAGRIVELRDREGAFTSLDELLDVAGMTQSRLARARPYLQELNGAEGSPH
jgi:competence protein ComEA